MVDAGSKATVASRSIDMPERATESAAATDAESLKLTNFTISPVLRFCSMAAACGIT